MHAADLYACQTNRVQIATNAQDRQAATGLSGCSPKRVSDVLAAKLTVKKLQTLSFWEDDEARRLSKFLSDHGPSDMHHNRMKHLIVETYDCTKKHFRADLVETVSKSLLPVLHGNLDLWTDKISGLKYCGIRVMMMTANGELKSYLLAVRCFNPPTELIDAKRASDILVIWLQQVC